MTPMPEAKGGHCVCLLEGHIYVMGGYSRRGALASVHRYDPVCTTHSLSLFHTHTRKYIHTYIYTYIHTYIHTCIHAYSHINTNKKSRTLTLTQSRTANARGTPWSTLAPMTTARHSFGAFVLGKKHFIAFPEKQVKSICHNYS
jgi:hypothetical protein